MTAILPKSLLLLLLLLLTFNSPGCREDRSRAGTKRVLRLATTTSTRDSGLLDKLLPRFETAQNCRVDIIAVGTGAALKLGETGDADILLVHDRRAEEAFMEAGHGIRHEPLMYNYFSILGPQNDPARIRDVACIDALNTIAEGRHRFLSRGDDSGTHRRELDLWKAAGITPSGKHYVETGQGMGRSLIMANEMQGYILADMGTYLKFADKIDLEPLTAASDDLRNTYAAIGVAPDKHRMIADQLANALVEYLISNEAQQLIQSYQIGGRQLFHPLRLGSQP